jgi:hypothetical protein
MLAPEYGRLKIPRVRLPDERHPRSLGVSQFNVRLPVTLCIPSEVWAAERYHYVVVIRSKSLLEYPATGPALPLYILTPWAEVPPVPFIPYYLDFMLNRAYV